MRSRTASRLSASQETWWRYFFERGHGRKENVSQSALGIGTGTIVTTIVTNKGDGKKHRCETARVAADLTPAV